MTDEKALVATASGELLDVGEPLAIDRTPAGAYLAGLRAGNGRRTMQDALHSIARQLSAGRLDAFTFPWHELRYQHVAALRAWLMEKYAPATTNKHLAALRGVLRAAWRLGLMSADDLGKALDVQPVKGTRVPAGRSIAPGEIVALMQCCANDPTPAGARDAAIIALLYGCGMRRAELVALDLADYVDGKLRVMGKGNKERWAYLANGAGRAMADYLTARGDEPGPLFWAGRRGGHLVPGDRMSTQAVFGILRSRARAAGVAEMSPHDFRRTFVGDLLDAGADIATVAALAGHASVTTTQRYDRRGERAKERAANMLPVPYFGRSLV